MFTFLLSSIPALLPDSMRFDGKENRTVAETAKATDPLCTNHDIGFNIIHHIISKFFQFYFSHCDRSELMENIGHGRRIVRATDSVYDTVYANIYNSEMDNCTVSELAERVSGYMFENRKFFIWLFRVEFYTAQIMESEGIDYHYLDLLGDYDIWAAFDNGWPEKDTANDIMETINSYAEMDMDF